jgi:hypothetical protein
MNALLEYSCFEKKETKKWDLVERATGDVNQIGRMAQQDYYVEMKRHVSSTIYQLSASKIQDPGEKETRKV